MSKKNEVVVVEVPGAEQTIDTSIDMKLSKQDLIDVVVEETRERLESEVADARDAFEEEKKEVDKAHGALKKLFQSAIESKYTKEYKILKSNGKVEREPSIDEGGDWSHRGLIATEYGVLECNSLREENVRTSKGHYGRRTVDKHGNVVTMRYGLPESLEAKNQTKDTDENTHCIVQISLQLKLTKAESTKLFTPFAKLVTHLGETKATLDALEDQFKNVDKMGKKAKTQLVKRILESSAGGQSLLSNIGAIKANVGQLLLEATKK